MQICRFPRHHQVFRLLLLGVIWIPMLLLALPATADSGHLWQESSRPIHDERLSGASSALAFTVDVERLETQIRATGLDSEAVLLVPRPEGGRLALRLKRTATLAPETAAPETAALEGVRRFPDILTFEGHGLDPAENARARITWSPFGFRAWVRDGQDSFFVEAMDAEVGSYISYRPMPTETAIECNSHQLYDGQADRTEPIAPESATDPAASTKASGTAVNVIRIAVAATSEFNANVGNGSTFLTYLHMISTINEVNGILEPEAGVRLQLIPESYDLIYVDANDPYDDYISEIMLDENQANMEQELGLDSFDLGHVFSWNVVGGLASTSSLCLDWAKAKGVSGWQPNPLKWIQLVAHEIAHQLGANHSFNSIADYCGGARSLPTAWEAGSGTSLMSYGGSLACAPEHLGDGQKLSQLHSLSREQIRERVDFMKDYYNCGSISSVSNNNPAVLALTYRPIPAQTPFRLQALAADVDGDDLTFCWEQRDLGSASPPHEDNGSRPLFALECGDADDSAGSLQTDFRTFPAAEPLLQGTTDDVGQTLPATDRDLYFGVSVRDGRGGFDDSQTVIEVTTQSGPFQVIYPNSFQIWDQPLKTVSWQVAGTTAAPVSCPRVDIHLSLDGGTTFSTTLLSNTNNDGFAWIYLPSIRTYQGRIRVSCSDHIFFDVSDSNLWILL